MQNSSGEIFTGNTRTRQSPIFSSVSIASTTATTSLIKFFNTARNVGTEVIENTNLNRPNQLPGKTAFTVSAMRIVASGAQADLRSMNEKFTFQFSVAGILILDAPMEFWSAGAGINTAVANGVPDSRSVTELNMDPVTITDDLNFKVEALGSIGFTTTAALFLRVYLEGRLEEAC